MHAADNVKAAESLNAFEKCLQFMSLNAMKCNCGSIFVRSSNKRASQKRSGY